MDNIKDWAQPLADVIKSAWWPTAIGVIVFIFRKDIQGLLQRITFFKSPGGAEAAFGDPLANQKSGLASIWRTGVG